MHGNWKKSPDKIASNDPKGDLSIRNFLVFDMNVSDEGKLFLMECYAPIPSYKTNDPDLWNCSAMKIFIGCIALHKK